MIKFGFSLLVLVMFGIPFAFFMVALFVAYPALLPFLFAFIVLLVTFAPKETK